MRIYLLNPVVPWQLQLANIISWIAAGSYTYITNRAFVLKVRLKYRKRNQCVFLSRAGTLLMDMGIMFVTVTLCGINDKIAKLIVWVVVTIGNYVLSKFFVYKNKG